MQDEVNHQAVSFTVRTTKVTTATILRMMQTYLRYRKTKKLANNVTVGKQSVKKLAKQGQGLSTLELNDQDLKKFNRIMRKYGVDYAVTKNNESDPPTHTIFFKGRDADAIAKAFSEYTAKMTRKKDKPSVLQQLQKYKEFIKQNIVHRQKNKNRSRTR